MRSHLPQSSYNFAGWPISPRALTPIARSTSKTARQWPKTLHAMQRSLPSHQARKGLSALRTSTHQGACFQGKSSKSKCLTRRPLRWTRCWGCNGRWFHYSHFQVQRAPQNFSVSLTVLLVVPPKPKPNICRMTASMYSRNDCHGRQAAIQLRRIFPRSHSALSPSPRDLCYHQWEFHVTHRRKSKELLGLPRSKGLHFRNPPCLPEGSRKVCPRGNSTQPTR